LLVRLLPLLETEPVFALKGGTAINLFYRDLPRLSVDIDLTYLPRDTARPEALAEIDAAMGRLKSKIEALPTISARRIDGGGAGQTRVQAIAKGATVKIETSPVSRGTVFDTELRRVVPAVEARFGFAEVPIVSFADLYAGKLCAALDRQHPRDLFDVAELYKHEGVTDDLFRAFLIYAISSKRPLHELLDPNLKDIADAFRVQFEGMTETPVSLQTLIDARARLIADIQSRLTGPVAAFLKSVQNIKPDFGLIDLPHAADLPAVRFKLQNLQKFAEQSPDRYADQTQALNALLMP
jgi:predicted nucleotidyltransferase component of viral defense system